MGSGQWVHHAVSRWSFNPDWTPSISLPRCSHHHQWVPVGWTIVAGFSPDMRPETVWPCYHSLSVLVLLLQNPRLLSPVFIKKISRWCSSVIIHKLKASLMCLLCVQHVSVNLIQDRLEHLRLTCCPDSWKTHQSLLGDKQCSSDVFLNQWQIGKLVFFLISFNLSCELRRTLYASFVRRWQTVWHIRLYTQTLHDWL